MKLTDTTSTTGYKCSEKRIEKIFRVVKGPLYDVQFNYLVGCKFTRCFNLCGY